MILNCPSMAAGVVVPNFLLPTSYCHPAYLDPPDRTWCEEESCPLRRMFSQELFLFGCCAAPCPRSASPSPSP
uniref:Uncharacterized protein n=1 Tax=Arundo donax TaxID=35708 RepID=A0A0A9BHI1_ARUDO